FWPHYTHQNGLIVDFMVPVLDKKSGEPEVMPTHLFSRWSYAIDFDSTASNKKQRIHFESMAEHLYYLKKLAPKYGLKIKRIIFEPTYLPMLYKTDKGAYLEDIQFIYKNNWLRHDDHYHTEFEILGEK